MADTFVFGKDVASVGAEPGVTRKVLAHSETMMIVEVRFETGAAGAPHAHPHEQVTYVAAGRFRFTNDGETREVAKGDTLRFAPDVEHSTVCLEAGCLVDVFHPPRLDFL